VTLYTSDGAAIEKRLKSKTNTDVVWNQAGKARYCFAPDPDGNAIEIVELPAGAEPALLQRAAIGLTVGDVEKSRAFYGKLLGLAEQPTQDLPNGGTKYSYMAGPTVIKFWQAPANAPKKTGGPQEAIGFRYFTFMVKDADAAQKWLTEAGAKIVMPPTDFGRLARILFIADPDGNFIEFAAPPKPAAK
ncbi:MAG: VOC family protein, partial [Bryobacteraceae bacterium]